MPWKQPYYVFYSTKFFKGFTVQAKVYGVLTRLDLKLRSTLLWNREFLPAFMG